MSTIFIRRSQSKQHTYNTSEISYISKLTNHNLNILLISLCMGKSQTFLHIEPCHITYGDMPDLSVYYNKLQLIK